MSGGLNRLLSLIMSVVFIAVGIFVTFSGINRLVKLNAGQYAETQAVITRIESREVLDTETGSREMEYDLTVEYSVDGKKYVSQLSENPREFHEGMELTVLYDVDHPDDVVLPGTAGAFIMIGMGIVAILAAAVLLFKMLRGR